MKKANEILNHLLYPFNDKLQEKRCLKKIISLLPPKYNKYITNSFIKGDVLYINVSHPALRQEIFYNKHLIFSIIKTFHQAGECLSINPKKVVTNYQYKKSPPPPKFIKFYIKESGNFEINSKNEEIKNKFQEIKEIISAKKN